MAELDRSLVRAHRGTMARSVRRDAAAAVAARAATVEALATARRLGAYMPHHGELDPMPIVRAAWRRGAAVYVPRAPDGEPRALDFVELTAHTTLERGRFGIAVPAGAAPSCDATALDVVLVPLVAFDDHLTRVGSGAGYYDRTFAARRHAAAPPLLVGLAYAWQQVDELQRAAWDVALDLVVTEQGITWPR